MTTRETGNAILVMLYLKRAAKIANYSTCCRSVFAHQHLLGHPYPHPTVKRSMELFATKVMPACQ